MNRRGLLVAPAVMVPAPAAAGVTYAVVGGQRDRAVTRVAGLEQEVAAMQQRAAAQEADAAALRERIGRLGQRWVASGGGINRKLMPDASGQPTAELLEVFSFDRNHVFCRVETNQAAFAMPTLTMGNVLIPPNSFFMSMAATSIDQFDVQQRPDGKATVTMGGVLDCHTEVVTASVTVGSRTAAEPASYEIVAVDGGVGGGARGDSFAFTVLFDEKMAPVNHAIFGPQFTFTGEMVAGEITIRNLASLAP